jgi:hypothetical protein
MITSPIGLSGLLQVAKHVLIGFVVESGELGTCTIAGRGLAHQVIAPAPGCLGLIAIIVDI